MAELTAKQALFVREYLVDMNATRAAERAGYSDGSYGRQLITKPHVEAALLAAREKLEVRTEITAERVLQELAMIGFADIGKLFEWDEESAAYVPSRDLSREERAAIQSVKAETTHFHREDGGSETKIKLELRLHDKLGALREIGKHLGIAERLEHTGKDGGPIETRELSDDEVVKRLAQTKNRLAKISTTSEN